MKKIWQFFCSLQLTVYLGLALCLLLLFGSICFIVSGEHLAGLNSQVLFPWLIQSGLAGLTYTWWLWLTLLVPLVLAVNTIVCSIDRLSSIIPRLWRPKLEVTPQWLAGISLKGEVLLSVPLSEVTGLLQKALPFAGFKRFQLQEQTDGGLVIFAQKGRWAVFGPYIAHLGFLLVLAGHLVSGVWSFKDFGVEVRQGEKYPIPASSYWVRLQDISLSVIGDKSSGLYGTIDVGEGNTHLQQFKLGPNRPLFFQGLAFYQSDYERRLQAVSLSVSRKGEKQTQLFNVGEKKDVGGQISLYPYMVIPDFAFGQDGMPFSLSENYDNPALYLLVFDNNVPAKEAWLFLNNPKLKTLYYNDCEIKFNGFSAQSVLFVNIARNPGALTALAGGIIFVVGSIWFLLGNHRRVWFYLKPQEGKTLLVYAGIAGQKRLQLRQKLEHVVQRLTCRFPVS